MVIKKAPLPQKQHSDYTIGWVCALPKEQTAATAMLDETHADLTKPSTDQNTYTLGSILNHNVVITCLPKGKYGNNSASAVATHLANTFPAVKFVLMVGIGGGVPPKVRLGDVVVGTPVGAFPGVVQWDMGKTKNGEFERTGALNNPPTLLLTAVGKLETDHETHGTKIPEYLEEMGEKFPRLKAKYLCRDKLQDVLFKATYEHVNEKPKGEEDEEEQDEEDEDEEDEEEDEGCQWCDTKYIVKRKEKEMRVHYGLIASGNQVIKDASMRKDLNAKLGGEVLCIEMEAAGVLSALPCLVIRGICDYADSHKNKAWQEHAAAVAAAFAKELLGYLPPDAIAGERSVKDVVSEQA
ncbi:hypothetical protein H072_7379 [Dactylellina haptotyla CBS 200.50]|uniref:Nucleoside phosphorylase domain-containing protein n=1 Tax=Dactylellina haptotyla (strain CBS 200.50) TaxID=1284197 RepID=S8BHX6_DACHA|nr:hypothetical protein H072_7379 [Dactylellina haptotyla CBS 200.50]